jgi:ABC-type branched-subunit amino acid transport system ATPase component
MVECKHPISFKNLIFEFLKQNKFIFICYILLILLIPLQDIGLPHVIGLLTKNIKENKSIYTPLLIIVIIVVILQIGVLISGIVEVRIFPAFQSFMRNKVITHLMNEMKTNYEDVHTGKLIMHLHKFPTILYSHVEDIRNILIPQIIVYIFAIFYFSYYDIYIGIALLVIIFIIVISIFYTLDKCHILSTHRDDRYNTLMEEISDIMKNSVSVLNANSEKREMNRNNEFQDEYYEYSVKSLYCAYNTSYYLIPLVIIFFTWSLYRLYNNVKKGKLESFKMISIILILLYIMRSLLSIVDNLKEQVFKWGSIQNSFNLFNNCAPNEQQINTIPDNIPNGFVLNDISYSYGTGRPTLSHLNLVIPPNKVTLVVGEIGSGKSTLIKLLMKYQIPQEGTIYYNRRPYSSINVDELRKIIGYIPQQSVLFNRSIYENITYNNTNATKDDVINLMKQLNIDNMLNKFPDGLDTNVGVGGNKLSGGQRQIVWLLRVILQNPEVIILDEPTSALDDDTKEIIQNMINHVIKDKTIIMITHDKNLYKLSNNIITLKATV